MHVIATDEAGYGPKLGPLVIVGTCWQIAEVSSLEQLANRFAALSQPVKFGPITTKVDDSKAVFKSRGGNEKLDSIVAASLSWCDKTYRTLSDLIELVAPDDAGAIASTDWYRHASPPIQLDQSDIDRAIAAWGEGGIRLVDVGSRVIIAKSFNAILEQGGNKADLLSQSTLETVRRLITEVDDDDQFEVFCDRHGGRRYYLSVLQHTFPEASISAIEETQSVSRYLIEWKKRKIGIAFTVKGDRFAPVAMSSIHAKFMREWMMDSFNRFFAEHHAGNEAFRPTAGYPVDADRFLSEIQATLENQAIRSGCLIRAR